MIIPDEEFIEGVRQHGPNPFARMMGINVRGIYTRRNNLERKLGIKIDGPNRQWERPQQSPARHLLEVKDGLVLVGGDAHYRPGPPSLMHRAFVKFCKTLKPKAVIMNGDVMDFPSISRFQSGWEAVPKVAEEIETAKERLHEIAVAAFKAPKIWTLGNHDQRFEYTIASRAPEMAKVHGIHLKDHFPDWIPCRSVWINNDVVITHQFKGGQNAARNNTIHAGKNIITNHLHNAQVCPFDDYNGTRWGVDTGCIADTYSPAFDYLLDNSRNWRSAFAVLTFRGGKLMEPSLVLKWDDTSVQFRGEVIAV